jgi:ABC-type multidrug transport system ATPase subunit
VSITGRLGAIIDLGVGFNPELTGRENIYISGVCSGLTRSEVQDKFDAIVEFSELESFLDFPLRTYSTGMHVRLAFAVASHIEPEVLLVDEVLAVGDMAFQKKCMDRMKAFKKGGCTGLIVSHAPQAIMEMCDDAIWLDHGRIVAFGPAQEVVDQYVEATGVLPPKPEEVPEQQQPTMGPDGATFESTTGALGDGAAGPVGSADGLLPTAGRAPAGSAAVAGGSSPGPGRTAGASLETEAERAPDTIDADETVPGAVEDAEDEPVEASRAAEERRSAP